MDEEIRLWNAQDFERDKIPASGPSTTAKNPDATGVLSGREALRGCLKEKGSEPNDVHVA